MRRSVPASSRPSGRRETARPRWRSTMTVEIDGPDTFQRLLSPLFVDGQDMNLAMIDAGLAEGSRGPESGNPYTRQYQIAEEAACAARRGMWALGDRYESPGASRHRVGISPYVRRTGHTARGAEVRALRFEGALAEGGAKHTHLGYEVLVWLKRDERIERHYIWVDVEAAREPLEGAATDPSAGEAVVIGVSGTRGDREPARCWSMDLDSREDAAQPSASAPPYAAHSGRSVSASPRGGSPIGVHPVLMRSSSGRSGGCVSRSRFWRPWYGLRPPHPRFPCSSSALPPTPSVHTVRAARCPWSVGRQTPGQRGPPWATSVVPVARKFGGRPPMCSRR